MPLAERLSEYIRACFTGIWIESHEHEDAIQEIAQLCQREKWRLATWDLEQGLRVANAASAESSGSDPLAAIRSASALAAEDSSAILVLVNFHRFLQSAEIVQALAKQLAAGKQNRTFVMILSPVVQPHIQRGSHVDPTPDGQWQADLSPTGGPMLGPFPLRSEALAAESQWLEENWLTAR